MKKQGKMVEKEKKNLSLRLLKKVQSFCCMVAISMGPDKLNLSKYKRD